MRLLVEACICRRICGEPDSDCLLRCKPDRRMDDAVLYTHLERRSGFKHHGITPNARLPRYEFQSCVKRNSKLQQLEPESVDA